MAAAKTGDTVKVHYTGRLEDGTEFDSSTGREPLEFKLGDGEVIPGFEQAVEGMDVDESKTVMIPADDAYGQRRDDLVMDVGRSEFPEGVDPEVGQRFRVRQKDGHEITVVVTDVGESQVTLDANHPLAGKDLTFEIQLVAVA